MIIAIGIEFDTIGMTAYSEVVMPPKLTSHTIMAELDRLDEDAPIVNPERFTWQFRRKALRQEMRSHGGNLGDFYHWPTIRDAFLTGKTASTMTAFRMLSEPYLSAAKDPPLGGINSSDLTRLPNGASGTYVRQALACQLLARHLAGKTDAPLLSTMEIFEFGGGFGAFANILHTLGYGGLHTIYDFPECSLLQKWYLDKLGVRNVHFSNTLTIRHTNIFVSVCALEEAPPATRVRVLDSVQADYYLIWHTLYYYGDATEWFNDYFSYKNSNITIYPSPDPNQRIMIVET